MPRAAISYVVRRQIQSEYTKLSSMAHNRKSSVQQATKDVGSIVPHARGSIVRIKLQNFLTFDGVEIKPSSQLNVIVGPNGTGKSSVVCAICIGLGGATKLLGRAKEIKEFVKHGKRDGFVEIELCETRKAGKNPVIKRKISADQNSSTWFINGVVCKQADVTKLIEGMNIQLQNKCVFLPQDMVVEFAKMNMHQRLEETELAVGPKDMFKAHEELKNLRLSSSTVKSDLAAKKSLLQSEDRKNQLLERDVERFKNRQRFMADIKWVSLKKLWLEYESARNAVTSKKNERKEAMAEVKKLKQTYQPIKEKHKTQEDALKIFKDSESEANLRRRKLLRNVAALQENLSVLGDKLEGPRQDLEQAKKDEAERKGKIEKMRLEIESYKTEMDALESQESITLKIQSLNNQRSGINQQVEDNNFQMREMAEERQRYNDIVRRNEDELRRMQDIRSQRLKMLQQIDHWAYDALMWLEKNQHLFIKPILEPIMVSVNVRDPRYTAQVEASLGGRDFVSFVAQTEEDRELFLKEVRDKLKLKVNVVRAPNKHLSEYKPRICIDELKRYGFDKVIIELIQAPEALLCYFCQYHALHEVPIAGELTPEQLQGITDNLPGLRVFFAGSSRYSVTHSRYRKETSTRVGVLRPPRVLIANVDVQHKQKLEQEIEVTLQKKSELEANYLDIKEKDDALRQEGNKRQQEKNALKKVIDQRKSYAVSIKSREAKIANLTDVTFDLQKAEEKCQRDLDKIHRDRLKCFVDIKENLRSAVAVTKECVEASLRVKTSERRVNFLLHRYDDVKNAYENAERQLASLDTSLKQAKEKAHLILQRARGKSKVDSPADNQEMMDQFQRFPNELDDLLELLHSLQAQADMCEGIDRSVVQEYDDRKSQIESLNKEIEQKENHLKSRDERISKLKEEWLSALKDLVSGISDRFRCYFSNHTHMEAAGEVCFVESEDFTKCGIEIKVKFRDNEQLQALNAQRQSGGERSVSTMLYLMALQGGSSCPFRVVDEINQGMDPVNERHVFNLIVKSAAEGAQYFLLTPKLLHNLQYSDAVQVHMVNNGQESVEYSEYNLETMLN